jgi:hypothetical protein
MRLARFASAGMVCLVLASACASLGPLERFVRPPTFTETPGRQAEIRLLPPSVANPVGGAGVRLWIRVSNPNGFAFRLSTLRGSLFLDDVRATTVDLPLGLAVAARGETDFPLDLTVSFSDLPQLASTLRRVVGRDPIPYRLDGTVGVDAGQFGEPTFGPMTLLEGTVR